MSSPKSFEIGDLFEKASVRMLEILFEAWGYKTETLRRQKSGTQLGFDIFLKVYNESSLPIHVFVECKGSASFNTIDKYELAIKSDQLKRNAFPVKDVHLFFSPTRQINYANDEPNLEEDDNPFCVVDMMVKKDTRNDVLDLFFTYAGDDADIINYREQILKPITSAYTLQSTYDEAVENLKNRFQQRIEGYLSKPKQKDFTLLSPSYWNRIKEMGDRKRLPDYYLRLDATKQRLLDVVANEYHVANTQALESVLSRIRELEESNGGLLKILSNGGDGKSTFLLDIGKLLCADRVVFLIDKWRENTLERIGKQLLLLRNDKMPIILLDNAANFPKQLDEYGEELANWQSGIIVIISERSYRYEHIARIKWFENLFPSKRIINLNNEVYLEKIFSKFFSELSRSFPNITKEGYAQFLKIFTAPKNLTVAERMITVLKAVSRVEGIHYLFDWVEWIEIHKGCPLEHLYLIVATFYQFGTSVTIDFCLEFKLLAGVSDIQIIEAIDKNVDQPILRNYRELLLRHEKLAEWFIDEENQKEKVKAVYLEWLNRMSDNKIAR